MTILASDAVSRTVRITQTDGAPDYCRRDNGVGFDDYDSDIGDLSGAGNPLWGGAAHVMYFGADAKFMSMGLRLVSAPSIGAITWEYSDGAAGWVAFNGSNPFHDSTSDFTVDGFMAWQDPPGASAWGKNTVDGTEAYWIRASIGGHTGTGNFLNFLRNQTLQGPLRLAAQIPAGNVFRDISDDLQSADVAYTGPTTLTISCKLKATIHPTTLKGGPNLALLHYWWQNRAALFIEDLAQSTAPPDLDCESYWKDYTGRLSKGAGDHIAPFKMSSSGYELHFMISAVTAVLE